MAKKKTIGPGAQYHTYTWGGDHDPIIDWIKTLAQDEGVSIKELAETSGNSYSTIHGWFDGKVKQPRHPNIKATVRALGKGYDYVIAKNGRVIKFNGRT